jgi:hypothetical protein
MQYISQALLGGAQSLLNQEFVNAQLTLTLKNLTKLDNQAVISFASPQPYSQHQLWESTDLKNWNTVGTVSFTNTVGSNVLATTSIVRSNNFYRVLLLGP